MHKKVLTCIIVVWTLMSGHAQKENIWTVGIHSGLVIGDYEDSFSINTGLDVSYLYGLSKKIYVGGAVGLTNYLGKDSVRTGNVINDVDDIQFVPVAVSLRLSPFKSFLGGADIGYAIGINEENDGGFYLSPRLTYMVKKLQVYAGYRLIGLDENLSSIQLGFAFKLF